MPKPTYRDCGDPDCIFCHAESALARREAPPVGWGDLIGWGIFGAIVIMVVAMLIIAGRTRAQTLPTTQPTSRPAVTLPPGIVTAWYYPPLENLATVKARGCNAVVGPELGNPPRVTVQQYCAELQRLGLGLIGDKKLLVSGYVPPCLIAWILDDEPNSANHNVAPETVALQAQQFRALKPGVPVVLNLAGDKLTSAQPKDFDLYNRYVALADVVWADWYPLNREAGRYPLTFKRDELAFLKARGARVVGSVVETSWQKLNNASPKGRGPTPDEYEQEVNLALGAGATWILHFSTAPSGYPWPLAYDPTAADVVARITAVNAKLNPPAAGPLVPIPDVLTARVDALEQRQAATDRKIDDALARLRQALAPPATQPNP